MRLRFLLVCMLACWVTTASVWAQTDSSLHVRISLITGGPGTDAFESFGHTCIRVIDSTKTGRPRDLIYNYGFYDPADGSLVSRAFNGRIQVFLETTTYPELIREYTDKKRLLAEQELLIPDAQKKDMIAYLAHNLLRENRYYDYATVSDNCTTRVFDLIKKTLGSGFKPGPVLPEGSRLNYRDLSVTACLPYERKTMLRLFTNLIYSSPIDRKPANDEIGFVPNMIKESMAGATLNGKPLCGPLIVLLPETIEWPSETNWPLLISIVLALVIIAGAVSPKFSLPASIAGFIMLLTMTTLGLLMIRLWSIDGEPAWKWNYNLLWAVPTHIIFPFLKDKIRRGYCIVALAAIGFALVVNALRIQEMPLTELWPVWLALVFYFGYHYKKSLYSAR